MKTILLALFSISYSLTALAEVKINFYWDCYFPDDVVVCDELKTSYLHDHKAFKITPVANAYFKVSLRSTALNNETSYQIAIDGVGNLPEHHDVDYKLANGLSADIKFEKILKMLNVMTVPYELILGSDSSEETGADKPYYITPNIGGNGSQGQTTTNINSSVGLIANYSTTKWRIVGNAEAGLNINNQQATAFNQELNTQVYYFGGGVGTIRSLNKHWSIAVIAEDTKVNSKLEQGDKDLPENVKNNTADNYAIRAGAEWIAVPFITEKNNGNLAIRYMIGGEHHRYVDPATYEYLEEEFIKHSLVLAMNKHSKSFDISLNVGAYTSAFREQKLQGISASTGVDYRITPQLTLSASFGVEYVKNRILSPAAGPNSFVGLTGSSKNNLYYNGSVTLKYTLGNTRLFKNEQRWKRP